MDSYPPSRLVIPHRCWKIVDLYLHLYFVRADLPSELWWHVLKNMTAKEGSAMACTFSTIPNIIRNPNFVWLPSELHLVLLTAQEAVRCDPSTHLPLNLQQGEVGL